MSADVEGFPRPIVFFSSCFCNHFNTILIISYYWTIYTKLIKTWIHLESAKIEFLKLSEHQNPLDSMIYSTVSTLPLSSSLLVIICLTRKSTAYIWFRQILN